MSIQDFMQSQRYRVVVGSVLGGLSLFMWAIATPGVFPMSVQTPGYLVFYLCCPALLICSIMLARGNRKAVRGVQGLALIAFAALQINARVMNDAAAIMVRAVFFLGIAVAAQTVLMSGRMGRSMVGERR